MWCDERPLPTQYNLRVVRMNNCPWAAMIDDRTISPAPGLVHRDHAEHSAVGRAEHRYLPIEVDQVDLPVRHQRITFS
jgi:hypothetical protein